MNIALVTLFAEFFEGPLATGLVGKAIASGRTTVRTVDPRAFTSDRHRTVDDTPYGGGGGMVLKPEPMIAAIRQARTLASGPVVLMSPQGRPLEQADLQRWAAGDGLVLVSGRYEGFDERIRAYVDDEVSLGDFVLTGGEYAALVIVDGVVRLLPGTLGNKDCPDQDSFSDGLLEYPHYTRPLSFEGHAVPDVLQSGHHQQVDEWRHARALERTRRRRPDLLRGRALRPQEAALLRPWPAPPVLVALCARALTPDVVRVCAAFGVEAVAVVESAEDRAQAEARLAAAPEDRYPLWEGPRPRKHRRRPPQVVTVTLAEHVRWVDGWAALPAAWGDRPVQRIGLHRTPPHDATFVDPGQLLRSAFAPCVMVDPPDAVDAFLPVVRAATDGNRLPVVASVAVALERIIGEA